MIQNVIFDMGNVLFRFDPQMTLARVTADPADQQLLRAALFDSQAWLDADIGLLTDREKYDAVKDALPPRLWPALRRCVDEWWQDLHPIPGAADCVLRLKKAGYRLFVLSNAADSFYRYFPSLVPLDTWDGIVVSCEERVGKPDSAIFNRLLERFQLVPEDCLFIDDSPANTAAAQALGLHTLTFAGDYAAISQLLGSQRQG